ncbi:enhanced serine sensitivity protein SseB C-terminal domain-containing protein [Saccharibacillus sp. JS10]|uniref:enhanced serine sensitivity protein SseB C-terminal domain-containing protein n=1 Tax=Saccharibacillus sp. JS10 TaxID=2950552 RepID=UPI00210B8A47|nr:enhanced serine sensitivity protein SseB C-terminal domain-containing protein [Saccharibacillus sp. JS10]MCQ4088359.1 enhanced serine sensitivity protein SseB C-terminal domain-containing protein [Saccharibacillus sp. JS10]
MSFDLQNKLERALSAAVEDSSRRKEFYEELRRSELYTLRVEDSSSGQGQISSDDPKINLQLFSLEIENKSYIPVFSSLTMLQRFIDREMNYISIQSIDFFNLVRGSDVWLNPGAAFAKVFPASEIESILDGSLFEATQTYTVHADSQVLLGQPKQLPHELLSVLANLFETLPEVKMAYLAHYYHPETGDPPHTLIAIEVEHRWDQVIERVVNQTADIHMPNPPVDFVQLDGTSGLESYFESDCIPFYEKHKRKEIVMR